MHTGVPVQQVIARAAPIAPLAAAPLRRVRLRSGGARCRDAAAAHMRYRFVGVPRGDGGAARHAARALTREG